MNSRVNPAVADPPPPEYLSATSGQSSDADFVIGGAGRGRPVAVRGRVFLSPMAGFSDSPYRLICRRRGAGFAFTEFVSAEHIRAGTRHTLDLFRFVPEERPILFQIFGNQPATLLYAAQVAEELGPDVIDINMGCSVRTVAHKGSGAGMLRDPGRTAATMANLRRHLTVPLTAKIRLGWDQKSRNYLDMGRALVDSGVAMISVHGRTKSMGYRGRADWDAIGELAASVPVPVLGNGDVASFRQARERRLASGVAGVLIGRAAIGNPWIFAGEGATPGAPAGVVELMLEHLDAMLRFYGPRGLVLFRKHAARYLHSIRARSAPVKTRLLTCEDPGEFRRICLDLLGTLTTLNV